MNTSKALRRVPKQYRTRVRALVRKGWVIEQRKRHLALVSPEQPRRVLMVPGSPSDHRAFQNWSKQVDRTLTR